MCVFFQSPVLFSGDDDDDDERPDDVAIISSDELEWPEGNYILDEGDP